MSVHVKQTYCRICEAHCGLEVEVQTEADGSEKVQSIRPDKQHPVSKGYACIKGTAIGELHHDPDRVNQPLKKVDGEWQAISWPQAIEEIGSKVKTLRKRHGNRSIAHYTGNPTFFSAHNLLYSGMFLQALGSPNHYASHSIDANNKFHVATEMFGLSTIQPIPDFDHCDFMMCLGGNPVVSQMSVVSVPHALQKIRGIEERGGTVIIIDPRRSETAEKVGTHQFIRPGTDAYLLAAMLHVIAHEQSLNTAELQQHLSGLAPFIQTAETWTPERAAPITGIAASTIRQLARDYAAADGAVLYMSTGVNMGPFGSLAYWLLLGLSAITGNLDHRGGLLIPEGPADMISTAKKLGLGTFDEHRTLENNWHRVAGAFPVGALEEEIQSDHPERIRALFVTAGNPVHSVPGNNLTAAMERLDLMVAIDIQKSETAQRADYILPATDMLERSDYPLSHAMLSVTPWAQYTPAVVKPLHERKPEWWIFSELAKASGAPLFGKSPLNWLPRLNGWLAKLPGKTPPQITPDTILGRVLAGGGKVTLKQLKANPRGMPLPANRSGNFLGKRLATDDQRVHLAPPALIKDARRLSQLESTFTAPVGALRIIGRRERRSHNSWMHNNRFINHESGIAAIMNPADAKVRKLQDGQNIALQGNGNTLTLPVKISDEIMPGVLAVPHGWGHKQSGQQKAAALKGGNINELLPNAGQHMDPVSGQAIMLGHAIRVIAA